MHYKVCFSHKFSCGVNFNSLSLFLFTAHHLKIPGYAAETYVKQHRTCKPFRHIFYHKIPKTGSSTFTSILNRMIFKHNLTTYMLRMPKPHPNALLVKLGQKQYNATLETRFDMHVSHGIFNKDTLDRVMQNDTIYVSTLRHPFQHLISRFFYHYREHGVSFLKAEFDKMLRTSVFLHQTNVSIFRDTKYGYLENPMFKYYKINHTKAQLNNSYFMECIMKITSLFQVIITDKYDESLLLLRHKFCWDIKEILFISHKNASFSNKNKKPSDYGILYEKHQNISTLDYQLYSHFLEIHKQKVKAAGKAFQEELLEYRKAKASTGTFCWSVYAKLTGNRNLTLKEIISVLNDELVFEHGKFWDGFTITARDCIFMALCESDLWHARVALNYPISCERTIPGFRYNHMFCAKENKTNIFSYNNLHFPYSAIRQLTVCDLTVEYKR